MAGCIHKFYIMSYFRQKNNHKARIALELRASLKNWCIWA